MDWRVLRGRLLWLVAGLVWGGGSLLMLARPQPERTQGCQGPLPNAPLDHLARCDHGSRVSASSQDLWGAHHALWAVDGRLGSSDQEKWVSREKDPAPWWMVEWPQPQQVGRVVLHHAGVVEQAGYNTVDFDVQVRVGGEFRTVAEVRNNSETHTTHTFAPVSADAVRVKVLKADRVNNRARLYEVEVHGS